MVVSLPSTAALIDIEAMFPARLTAACSPMCHHLACWRGGAASGCEAVGRDPPQQPVRVPPHAMAINPADPDRYAVCLALVRHKVEIVLAACMDRRGILRWSLSGRLARIEMKKAFDELIKVPARCSNDKPRLEPDCTRQLKCSAWGAPPACSR